MPEPLIPLSRQWCEYINQTNPSWTYFGFRASGASWDFKTRFFLKLYSDSNDCVVTYEFTYLKNGMVSVRDCELDRVHGEWPARASIAIIREMIVKASYLYDLP